jgi:hypothetical protein
MKLEKPQADNAENEKVYLQAPNLPQVIEPLGWYAEVGAEGESEIALIWTCTNDIFPVVLIGNGTVCR